MLSCWFYHTVSWERCTYIRKNLSGIFLWSSPFHWNTKHNFLHDTNHIILWTRVHLWLGVIVTVFICKLIRGNWKKVLEYSLYGTACLCYRKRTSSDIPCSCYFTCGTRLSLRVLTHIHTHANKIFKFYNRNFLFKIQQNKHHHFHTGSVYICDSAIIILTSKRRSDY
jgi:hypothetical protein